jgi:regulator of protease activity HflC (stomatin/prohibitin superfamily)
VRGNQADRPGRDGGDAPADGRAGEARADSRAEGLRQSAILAAEGQAEAVKRVADAERYKLEVEAAGKANQITTVFGAIRNAQPDDRLIAIQYLETLKSLAQGDSNKVFIPYEASGVLGALGGVRELFRRDAGKPRPAPPAPAPER